MLILSTHVQHTFVHTHLFSNSLLTCTRLLTWQCMLLLQERGWHASVLELRRRDWFNVGRALFTRGYFKGSLTTAPGYAWWVLVLDACGPQLIVLLILSVALALYFGCASQAEPGAGFPAG